MVVVESEAKRTDGVTLVRATVRHDRTTAQRIRLTSGLDGPTWQPRRGSAVVPAWTDGTWDGVVEPDETRGVGFASPAAPTEPLVEVVSVSRARADEDSTEAVLSDLEEWAPPSDVLTREP